MSQLIQQILEIAKSNNSIKSDEYKLFNKFVTSELNELLQKEEIDIDFEGVSIINDFIIDNTSTDEIYEGWVDDTMDRAKELVQTFKLKLIDKCAENGAAYKSQEHLFTDLCGHLIIHSTIGLPFLPTLILCAVVYKITADKKTTICQFMDYYK